MTALSPAWPTQIIQAASEAAMSAMQDGGASASQLAPATAEDDEETGEGSPRRANGRVSELFRHSAPLSLCVPPPNPSSSHCCGHHTDGTFLC